MNELILDIHRQTSGETTITNTSTSGLDSIIYTRLISDSSTPLSPSSSLLLQKLNTAGNTSVTSSPREISSNDISPASGSPTLSTKKRKRDNETDLHTPPSRKHINKEKPTPELILPPSQFNNTTIGEEEGQILFSCPVSDCPYQSPWSQQVNFHHLSCHLGEIQFPCPLCKFTCNSQPYLSKHIKSIHNITPEGDKGREYFENKGDFIRHCKDIASNRGGHLLSSEGDIRATNNSMTWQCAEGHIWSASYKKANSVWCKICVAIEKKMELERLKDEVKREQEMILKEAAMEQAKLFEESRKKMAVR